MGEGGLAARSLDDLVLRAAGVVASRDRLVLSVSESIVTASAVGSSGPYLGKETISMGNSVSAMHAGRVTQRRGEMRRNALLS